MIGNRPALESSFFRPRNVAVIGASDRSEWSANLVGNLTRRSIGVDTHLVNPMSPTVSGHPTFRSVSEVGVPVDLAYVMVRADRVPDVLVEIGEYGTKNVIVLSSGFAEAGHGQGAQRQLDEVIARYGLNLLGPNASGYINVAGGVTAYSMSVPEPPLPGGAAFVLQSGGLVNPLMASAHAWGIGFSMLASVGNEAGLTSSDVVAHLLADDQVSSIGLFLESIRDAPTFLANAETAAEMGKPMVALVVGFSDGARRVALAHTGAVTANADVTAAALRQYGVVQVHSLEELIVTTAFLASPARKPLKPGLAVVSASGGACDIAADTAERLGIGLLDFGPATKESLLRILPDVGVPQNPLDLTGFVASDPDLPIRALSTVCEDDGVGAVLFQSFSQPSDADPDPEVARRDFRNLVRATAAVEVSTVLCDATAAPLTVGARTILSEEGVLLLPGLELGLRAIAAATWVDGFELERSPGTPGVRGGGSDEAVPWSEDRSMRYLASFGVPTVPYRVVSSAEAARAAASEFDCAVVVKSSSPDLPHKSDVGGVALGVEGPDAVERAFDSVTSGVSRAVPDVVVDAAVIAPMRTGGIELLVGATHDPTWGPVLAVGLGGVYVEVLRDVSLRLLPVSGRDVESMLDELRGARLLQGARGKPGVDRAGLVEAIVRIADAFMAHSSSLASLEVNPLLASPERVEALDALVIAAEAFPWPDVAVTPEPRGT